MRTTAVMSKHKNFIHVEGWEDGEPFSRELDGIDRWTTQAADTLRVDVDDKVCSVLFVVQHCACVFVAL